jgi:eukaryotic-like serine/threonine-protein kinase
MRTSYLSSVTANQPTPVDARIKTRSASSVVTKVRPDPLQGSIVLDRYRIQSRIARGGMSSVYLAQDTQNGVRVAIKVLRHETPPESRLRERFLNESRAVQRIDHRAVVKLIAVGTTDRGQIAL